MPVNRGRKNPFLLAPALSAWILVISAAAGFFSLDSLPGLWPYITALLLLLVAFGCPLALFLLCRGPVSFVKMGVGRPDRRMLGFAAAGAVVLILQSCILKLGLFRGTYDGASFTLLGMTFSGNVTSFWELLFALLSLVVLPAACTELFFRGAVMYEYRFAGALGQVLMSSLLFALTALDFSRFFVCLLGGLLLSAVAFLSGNLFCAMAVHTAYRLFSLFAEKYLWTMSASAGGKTAFWFLIFSLYLISLALFFLLAEKLLRRRMTAEEAPAPTVPRQRRPVVVYDILSAPPLMLDVLVFAIFAVVALFL